MKRETSEEKLIRMTQIERGIWPARVAGIDEAGRGPLAGPVAAACVCMGPDRLIPGVDDSKKLSEKRRESLYAPVVEAAEYVRCAFVPASVIDEINILNATRRAMEEAAAGFEGVFLVDAVKGLRLNGESRAMVHGDSISYMIAAASIVAKVERDRYMLEMDAKYPEYGFCRHKGYGTREHIQAIRKYGPCPEHRLTFIRKFLEDEQG